MSNTQQRITGCYSYTSNHTACIMPGDKACALYEKLKPFLRLVTTGNSFRLPPKWPRETGEVDNWPLAYRPKIQGKNCIPRPITWNPRRDGTPLTFVQFLRAYNIIITE